MAIDVKSTERTAYECVEKKEYQEASKLFCEAAVFYQERGEHQQAAICLTSAASCWELKAGDKALFYYAATFYEKAAKEAETAGDFEYAGMLYKHAGICYERDLEYVGFSECFYLSKECYRKSLSAGFFSPGGLRGTEKIPRKYDFKTAARRFASLVSLTFSSILWGHGERPQRTVVFGCFLILFFALLYTRGHVLENGAVVRPHVFSAAYFSMVTFAHIGYNDIVPVGLSKSIAIFEEFAGIFIFPIFITGLCRKYLRFL